MPMHQRCHVVGKINSSLAVDIRNTATFAMGNVIRIWLSINRVSRNTARKDFECFLIELFALCHFRGPWSVVVASSRNPCIWCSICQFKRNRPFKPDSLACASGWPVVVASSRKPLHLLLNCQFKREPIQTRFSRLRQACIRPVVVASSRNPLHLLLSCQFKRDRQFKPDSLACVRLVSDPWLWLPAAILSRTRFR